MSTVALGVAGCGGSGGDAGLSGGSGCSTWAQAKSLERQDVLKDAGATKLDDHIEQINAFCALAKSGVTDPDTTIADLVSAMCDSNGFYCEGDVEPVAEKSSSDPSSGSDEKPSLKPSEAAGENQSATVLERCVGRWNAAPEGNGIAQAAFNYRTGIRDAYVIEPEGRCVIAFAAPEGAAQGGVSTWVDANDGDFKQFVVDGAAALQGSNPGAVGDLLKIAKQWERRAREAPNASVDAEGKLTASPAGETRSSAAASPSPNEAAAMARTCEPVRASSKQGLFGPVMVEVRVEKGQVSCSEARHVARTYFSGGASYVEGASNADSYWTVSDGWRGNGRSESWAFDNARLDSQIGGSFQYICGTSLRSRPC